MKIMLLALTAGTLALAGCSGQFWGGAGTGVLGAGAGYEYKANEEMKKLEADRAAGRITQEEYNIRKDQIQRMSVIQ